jgi:hypothetical protein
MSKVVFSNGPAKSYINIYTGANGALGLAIGANVTMQAAQGTAAAPVNLIGATQIEVNAGHDLVVITCNNLISTIEATSGNIDFHNNYLVAPGEHTNVTVGDNNSLIITGTDLCLGTLTVGLNSTLNFTHNTHNYHIQTPTAIGVIGNNPQAQIQDMDKLVTICEFVNDKFATAATQFALDEVCYLRDYQDLNHNFVNLFMQQNGMVGTDAIDKFIAQNYFEFTAIAHDNNLPGSILEGAGPYDVLGEICSWLDLSDVNLG